MSPLTTTKDSAGAIDCDPKFLGKVGNNYIYSHIDVISHLTQSRRQTISTCSSLHRKNSLLLLCCHITNDSPYERTSQDPVFSPFNPTLHRPHHRLPTMSLRRPTQAPRSKHMVCDIASPIHYRSKCGVGRWYCERTNFGMSLVCTEVAGVWIGLRGCALVSASVLASAKMG